MWTATFVSTSGGGGGGGGGGSVLPWIGAGLLGVAAISAGVWIYSMVRLDQLSSNAEYRIYREAVGMIVPTPSSVCDSTYTNDGSIPRSAVGRDTCSEGATMEILQYVFLGLAVVFPVLGHGTWHAYRAIRGDGP